MFYKWCWRCCLVHAYLLLRHGLCSRCRCRERLKIDLLNIFNFFATACLSPYIIHFLWSLKIMKLSVNADEFVKFYTSLWWRFSARNTTISFMALNVSVLWRNNCSSVLFVQKWPHSLNTLRGVFPVYIINKYYSSELKNHFWSFDKYKRSLDWSVILNILEWYHIYFQNVAKYFIVNK